MTIRLVTVNKVLRWLGLILVVEVGDGPEDWTTFRLRRGRYPLMQNVSGQ